jgi:hypothetical protein
MTCRASGCRNSPTQGSPYCESHDEATFTSAADLQEASGVNAEPNPSEKRRCSQTNKKGEPCKAWALKDDPLGRCPAHAGVALQNLDPAKAQQRSAQVRRERSARARRSAHCAPSRQSSGWSYGVAAASAPLTTKQRPRLASFISSVAVPTPSKPVPGSQRQLP